MGLLQAGYAWRKYDCARPVFRYSGGPVNPVETSYVLWPVIDDGQLPTLNRWEKLGPAFLGFMSRGIGAPVACAYSAKVALELIDSELLYRAWAGEGSDAAEVFEYFLHNFLGVWWGDRTPFFVSNTANLDDILKR